jgi:hypothetical protein
LDTPGFHDNEPPSFICIPDAFDSSMLGAPLDDTSNLMESINLEKSHRPLHQLKGVNHGEDSVVFDFDVDATMIDDVYLDERSDRVVKLPKPHMTKYSRKETDNSKKHNSTQAKKYNSNPTLNEQLPDPMAAPLKEVSLDSIELGSEYTQAGSVAPSVIEGRNPISPVTVDESLYWNAVESLGERSLEQNIT